MSEFPIGPESAADEEFDSTIPDEEPRKSKYVFDEGEYLAKTIDIEKKLSAGGSPMYVIYYTLLSGPGTGLEFRKYLPDSVPWKQENTFKAYGITKDPVTKVLKFKKSQVVGKTVSLGLEKEEYNNKERMSIVKVSPATAQTASSPVPL